MPDDEAYDAVLRELSKLVDALREQRNDLTESLRQHRDVVFRSINLLNHEVLILAKRFDIDDEARIKRQQLIDATMQAIIAGQDQIRRWQWIRIGVELAALLIVIAFVIGANR